MTELTKSEFQLLRILAQGKSNKVIAYELGITEQTVKQKLTRIFVKLGVTNRTGAAVKTLKEGLIND